MLTIRQYRDTARHINAFVARREPFSEEMFAVFHTMSKEESETLVRYIGLEHRLAQRALNRVPDVECGKGEQDGSVIWYVMRHGDDCVKRRFYVQGEANACAVLANWHETEIHADYSPTGLWWRSKPHMKHVCGDMYVVCAASHQDT